LSGPSSPDPSAHAAHHVAGAPEVPGERPVGSTIERWALVALVLAMVALPTAEAIWRRFTASGVPGAAVYTQHFTLWVGFIGALPATASGHHLALSALDSLKNQQRRALDPARRLRHPVEGIGVVGELNRKSRRARWVAG